MFPYLGTDIFAKTILGPLPAPGETCFVKSSDNRFQQTVIITKSNNLTESFELQLNDNWTDKVFPTS